MRYDVMVIGGGPGAVAAVIYAGRKRLKTVLLTMEFGGQSIVSNDIQNWIGEKHISGIELAKKFEDHVKQFSDVVEVKMPKQVQRVSAIDCQEKNRQCDFEITTSDGATYQGKTVIVASGARRRKIGIPGEDQFNGKGVSYCSTCDAPLFAGKDVAVIGGGNAGAEAVIDLSAYAKKIYLIDRNPELSADLLSVQEIKKNSKVEILSASEPLAVLGDRFVAGLRYRNLSSQKETELPLGGIFVEVGSVPNSEIVKGLVEIDQWGQIIIDSKHATTSQPGIFAAGDVTDDPYKQNNISAGDGVKAALAAYNYILQRIKQTPAAG